MQLPLMMEMLGRKVLVVGGGPIGYRKAKVLADKGALVTCVSLVFCAHFQDSPRLICKVKAYETKDLEGMFMVIAATDSQEVNQLIYDQCHDRQLLCQTVDHYCPSDFSFMATREQEQLLIGVSTFGGSPVFAREMGEELMASVSDEQIKKVAEMIRQRKKKINQS